MVSKFQIYVIFCILMVLVNGAVDRNQFLNHIGMRPDRYVVSVSCTWALTKSVACRVSPLYGVIFLQLQLLVFSLFTYFYYQRRWIQSIIFC